MTFQFGLKQGQDLENRVAQPHQEFPGVPAREKVKAHTSRRPKRPEPIPVSLTWGMARSFLLSPGRDTSPSQGNPPSSMSLVPILLFIHLGEAGDKVAIRQNNFAGAQFG